MGEVAGRDARAKSLRSRFSTYLPFRFPSSSAGPGRGQVLAQGAKGGFGAPSRHSRLPACLRDTNFRTNNNVCCKSRHRTLAFRCTLSAVPFRANVFHRTLKGILRSISFLSLSLSLSLSLLSLSLYLLSLSHTHTLSLQCNALFPYHSIGFFEFIYLPCMRQKAKEESDKKYSPERDGNLKKKKKEDP